MSKGLLASIAILFAGASAALAQAPAAPAATGPTVSGPVSGPVAGGPVMTTAPIEGPAMYGGMNCGPNGPCGCPTDGCCPWYGRAEYLLWWTKGMPNSTPLATSVAPGTPTGGTPIPGAVGGAGTTVIMGGSDIDLGTRQGGRFTLGRWFDPQQTVAIEGSYFFLGSQSESQSAASLGEPLRPRSCFPFSMSQDH